MESPALPLNVSLLGAVVSRPPGAALLERAWQKRLSSTGTTILRARPSMPPGLGDVTRFPELVAELLRRGYTDERAQKVAGGSPLPVREEAERVAKGLRK